MTASVNFDRIQGDRCKKYTRYLTFSFLVIKTYSFTRVFLIRTLRKLSDVLNPLLKPQTVLNMFVDITKQMTTGAFSVCSKSVFRQKKLCEAPRMFLTFLKFFSYKPYILISFVTIKKTPCELFELCE